MNVYEQYEANCNLHFTITNVELKVRYQQYLELKCEICIGCRWLTVVHCPSMNDSNMFVNSSETKRGTSVIITCYPGYVVNGQTSVLVSCGSDGQWSPTNVTCQRKSTQLLHRHNLQERHYYLVNII